MPSKFCFFPPDNHSRKVLRQAHLKLILSALVLYCAGAHQAVVAVIAVRTGEAAHHHFTEVLYHSE